MTASMSIFSDQVQLIRASLLRLTGTELTGSRLRGVIDSACPELDLRTATGVSTGSGALAKLLSMHFSDIVHPIGKSGGDPLYLIGAPPDVAADVSPPHTNLWAAFASPGLGLEIVFDHKDNSLSVQLKDRALSAQQVRISPVSTDNFRNNC
jgi:hypothetical protein